MAIHLKSPRHLVDLPMCHGINLSRVTMQTVDIEQWGKTRDDWKCKRCAKAYEKHKEWEAKKMSEETKQPDPPKPEVKPEPAPRPDPMDRYVNTITKQNRDTGFAPTK